MADLSIPALVAFWALVALGGWVQTLTGFALGLIVMSGSTLFALLPVPLTAEIISMLVLVNGAMILRADHRHIDRAALGSALIGAAPAILLGFVLLHYLAGTAINQLRLLLGLFIALAAAQLVRRPHPWPERSPRLAFTLAGAAGGLLGGLFSTSGPPLIWLMYRQPLALDRVRVTLVSFFCLTQLWRLSLAITGPGLEPGALIGAAGAIPAIALGTWLARRHPPRIAPMTLRRGALTLLFLSGLALIATALLALTAG